MVQKHKRLSEIAGFFGKSPASVKMKINRLKLVVLCGKFSAQQLLINNGKKTLFLFMPYKGVYVLERIAT